MNLSLRRLITVACAALLAAFSTPSTRGAESAKPAAPRSFEVYWSQGTMTPEVLQASNVLDALKKKSPPTHPRVVEQQERLDYLLKNTPPLLQIKSTGGPLSALLAAIPNDGLRSFSIINSGQPADLDAALPPFELRNANWGTLIGVLSNLLEDRGLLLKLGGSDNHNPTDSLNVVCVLRHIGPPRDPQGLAPVPLNSFQLSEFIDGTQTVDVIIDAIRTAWTFNPANDPAALHLKYHPGTKLLFVSGPGTAITVAHQVIAGLRKTPVQR